MPIYGYRCDECGHELEVFQSMSDAPLKSCPVCGGKLRKLLYPVGVQFKGSGFYTTDYKNGRSKSETKSTEGSSGSGEQSEKKSSGEASGESGEKSGGKKTDAAASKEGG
jgi:putative FmdB family regulatory protein